MNETTLNRNVELLIEDLRREFSDTVPASRVTAVGQACFEDLRTGARITDFIPLLVYRYTHEELVRAEREELHHAA